MGGRTGGSSGEARLRLIERCARDEGLRQRLFADPENVLDQELGFSLPEGTKVRVVEETPGTIYLVLPPRASANDSPLDELSDRDLENAAGDQEQVGETFPLCTVDEGCWRELCESRVQRNTDLSESASPRDVRRRMIERSVEDTALRQRLLEHPKFECRTVNLARVVSLQAGTPLEPEQYGRSEVGPRRA